MYFRLLISKSCYKKENKNKVLENGMKIQTWLVNWKPELSKYMEFTNKAFDFIKHKTDIELPLIIAKVFVGVGNMIFNFQDKVYSSI